MSEKLVYNEESSIFQGSQDDYSEDLLNLRITETQSKNTMESELFDTERFSINLGVADWGPISTALLMTKFPKSYKRALPPCTVSQSSLSYNMLNSEKLPKFDNVYDFAINKNMVFILTSSVDLYFYIAVKENSDSNEKKVKLMPSSKKITG